MAVSYKTTTDPKTGQATTGPLDLSDYINTMTQRGYNSWNMAGNQWDEAIKAYERAQGVADKVSDRALDSSSYWDQAAREDRDFWLKTYKPGMEEQMSFARGYTTPERMMANRAAAGATVARTSQAGMDAAMRDLQSHNIDPSSGAYVGLKEGLALQKAAAQAGAMTKSDRDTEMLGQNYLANAIQTGAALPGQAVNESGLAMTQGNTALNAQLAPANAYFSWAGTAPDWTKIGDSEMKEWRGAAESQTTAGQRANELQETINARKAKESSGAGAGIGAALGGLGTIASFIPGWGTAAGMGLKMAGGMMGGMGGGGMSGGGAGPLASFGSGSTFAEGGMVEEEDDWDWEGDEMGPTPGVAEGNMVPPEASPSGGAVTDDVTAQVNVGEFVMPKDVTAWLGEKFFQKMIEKARAEMAGPQEAEPETMEMPPEAMALAPTFRSEGAAGGQRGTPFMPGVA